MQKLKLDLDNLRIESFPTAEKDETMRGTVRAHAYTYYYEASCGGPSCYVVCRSRYETPCV